MEKEKEGFKRMRKVIKMEMIREATVEPVRIKDLNIGDKLLYSDMEVTIKELPQLFRFAVPSNNKPIVVYQLNDPTATLDMGPFRYYYRIITSIKYDGCVSCKKELGEGDHPSDDDGGFCDRCYVQNTMGSYEDPETGKRWTDEEIKIAEENYAAQYM